jgi:hypothetical protein
MREYEDI